jgi:hypothetical protein
MNESYIEKVDVKNPSGCLGLLRREKTKKRVRKGGNKTKEEQTREGTRKKEEIPLRRKST